MIAQRYPADIRTGRNPQETGGKARVTLPPATYCRLGLFDLHLFGSRSASSLENLFGKLDALIGVVAGLLGFRMRDYLEQREEKADMPSMK